MLEDCQSGTVPPAHVSPVMSALMVALQLMLTSVVSMNEKSFTYATMKSLVGRAAMGKPHVARTCVESASRDCMRESDSRYLSSVELGSVVSSLSCHFSFVGCHFTTDRRTNKKMNEKRQKDGMRAPKTVAAKAMPLITFRPPS